MRVSRYAPVLAVAAIQLCWVAVTVVKSFHAAGGHFTFPMDDAYIHLAMAKNLAVHGVWGVTRHAFSSTSSSPLWTLLIAACFRVAGVWAPMPLLLNLVISTILLIVVDCELNRNSIGLLARSGILILLIVLTPLPVLVGEGMEHHAQVLLTLTLVILCCRTLAGQATPRRLASIFLVCPLLVMIRFEGLFVVFLLCVGFRRLSTIQHRHRIARRVVRNLFDSERRLRIAKLSAS